MSSIKVDFDINKIKAEIETSVKQAQKALDAQVLNDSNYFVPVDSSTLKKSGIENTVIGSGKVIWNTDYARKQYYGLNFDHSKQDNPNACPMWFEAAKAKHLKDWIRLVNEYIKRT